MPLIIKDSFSKSTETVPEKSPCTESLRNKDALFSKTTASFLPRVTIARKRN